MPALATNPAVDHEQEQACLNGALEAAAAFQGPDAFPADGGAISPALRKASAIGPASNGRTFPNSPWVPRPHSCGDLRPLICAGGDRDALDGLDCPEPAGAGLAGSAGRRCPGDGLAPRTPAARSPGPLLPTLSLRPEVVLNSRLRRMTYQIVQMMIRCVPALIIYGGTLAMLVCVIFQYRWGVFLSLLLYSVYMCINSWEMVIFGTVGIITCWIQSRNDWYALYVKKIERATPKGKHEFKRSLVAADETPSGGWHGGAADGLRWNDVFHVVMLPTYKTPSEILSNSLRALTHFRDARTSIGVCLAMEEREVGCESKAQALIQEFGDSFRFVTYAVHPPNLAMHIPGKSSNECWAFFELVKELEAKHGFAKDDPRVVITVIDDDSELHENYFEALTYHFLTAGEAERYLTIWQPPICHFKNYLSQTLLVRTASVITTLHELACLTNPIDCHVPFSSYSLSLLLASSVGGWDPHFISEDWHMFAKCALMTEGRVRTRPIFLPLLNYAPEEESVLATLKSRWTQATRHALGVSEVVYVVSSTCLGMMEVPTLRRSMIFLWRMLPIIGKYISVHFVVATLAVWPLLSHLLINVYMWRSWCDVDEIHEKCATCCVAVAAAADGGGGEDRVILHSWMVYFQQQANFGLAMGIVLAAGLGAFYFHEVKDRVDGSVDATCVFSRPLLHWVQIELEVLCTGWVSSLLFASAPEWIAALRIIFTLQFHHVVAGMVGRDDEDGSL